MKRNSAGFIPAVLLLTVMGCTVTGPDDEGTMRDLTVQERQVAAADNRFGLSFFRELNRTESGNIFISPFSLSSALSMTLNGARGETRTGMEQALALTGLSADDINRANQTLTGYLLEVDPDVTFKNANSIWFRQGFDVEPAFISTNQTFFDAAVYEEDFSRPAAVDKINGWVEDKTNGKIDTIIDQIDASVVMYLINAIYFKGIWQYQFDKAKTTDAEFAVQDGVTVPVKMMAMQASIGYTRDEMFEAVELPYGNGQYVMTIFLPSINTPVDSLIDRMNDTTWSEWTGRLSKQDVVVKMPRFKMELKYEDPVKQVLTTLGMGQAFSGQADFSGINPVADLYISRVIHKTFVEVDEEGTEAAAVTAVEIRETSAGGDTPPTVVLNRPFVFAIREVQSGALLFIGKMSRPTA